MSRDEEWAAAGSRTRHPLCRGVYPRPGSRPATTQGLTPGRVHTPAHHSARPVTAPVQTARYDRRGDPAGTQHVTDHPYAAAPLTWHGVHTEELLSQRRAKVATPRKGASVPAAAAAAALTGEPSHQPYQWALPQPRQQGFVEACSLGGRFCCIDTLTAITGATAVAWQEVSLAAPELCPPHFRARQAPSCCCLEDGLVLCRGYVVCTFLREQAGPEEGRAHIGRLPEAMRPPAPLAFAALARDVQRKELATLLVTPDGWITKVGDLPARNGAIDLSAIRFSVGQGRSLVDEVRLHTCDMGPGRLVLLQGVLATRTLPAAGSVHLAQLPMGLRPRRATAFAVVGARPGNYHLALVQPSQSQVNGGDLVWADSKWQGMDEVSLSGVLYEVAPEAIQHATWFSRPWTENRRKIVVGDFQRCLVMKYGSLEAAWRKEFDPDGDGSANFTKFGLGCKAAGYKPEVSRLWAMLDGDRNGMITFAEFSMSLRLETWKEMGMA